MSNDELLFFNQHPNMLPLYESITAQLLSRHPDMTVKVSKMQITLRNCYGFAIVSLPWRRVKGWPAEYLLVSFGLAYHKQSSHIAQAVEAYPNRWTHHVLVETPADIDAELLAWLEEAYAFSLAK